MDTTTPLILLHAFPVDARLWSTVVPLLRAHGLDPIVPDLRGFGTNEESLPSEPNLDVLADDVAALIERTGRGPAVVAGVSMGGYVAMNLARRYPQSVAGLVFVDTKAGKDSHAGVTGRLAFADRIESEGASWVADAMLPSLISESTIINHPAVEQQVREQIVGCPPATIAWIQRAMAKRPDSFDVIDSFAGPILMIVGSEDLLSPPAEAVAIAQAAQQATLVEIDGVGHLTPLESPTAVATALIDWVREMSDSAASE